MERPTQGAKLVGALKPHLLKLEENESIASMKIGLHPLTNQRIADFKG